MLNRFVILILMSVLCQTVLGTGDAVPDVKAWIETTREQHLLGGPLDLLFHLTNGSQETIHFTLPPMLGQGCGLHIRGEEGDSVQNKQVNDSGVMGSSLRANEVRPGGHYQTHLFLNQYAEIDAVGDYTVDWDFNIYINSGNAFTNAHTYPLRLRGTLDLIVKKPMNGELQDLFSELFHDVLDEKIGVNEKREAMSALVHSSSPDSLPYVERGLFEGRDFLMKCTAAKALRQAGTKSAVNALLKAAESNDQMLHAVVLEQLRQIKTEQVREGMRRLLTLPDDKRKAAALRIIARIGNQNDIPFVEGCLSDKNDKIRAQAEETIQALRSLHERR